jgi:hypothetical protein
MEWPKGLKGFVGRLGLDYEERYISHRDRLIARACADESAEIVSSWSVVE